MEAAQSNKDKKSDKLTTPDLSTPSTAGAGYPVAPSANGRVLLGTEDEIFPARPLPELDIPGARAFEAQNLRSGTKQFALLCDTPTGARVTSVGSYKNIKNQHFLYLIDEGIVYWPDDARQYFTLLFKTPPPRRLFDPKTNTLHRLREDKIAHTFIKPLLSVLDDFQAINLVHGAVSADNIFMAGEPGAEVAVLGECLSTSNSYNQHPLYMTIERGMAQPSGRGPATLKDDLYALGMCVALLVRGKDLLLKKSVDEIIQEKIEQGSFAAAAGGKRLSTSIADFLRGVLNDDPAERWGIEEAIHWAEGRRSGAKPAPVIRHAGRPFSFKGKEYLNVRALAMAFAANIPEAVEAIETGQILDWVKRNFENKALEDAVSAAAASSTVPEHVVARVCMALDPVAPVRYKNLSVLPRGFGTALTAAMARQEDIQAYAEILSEDYLMRWMDTAMTEDQDEAAAVWTASFEKARHYLNQNKMPGYGIERVAYFLGRDSVCMSPMLKRFFVFSPGHLLRALEASAAGPVRADSVLDRHMVAFISARESKVIDPYLVQLVAAERASQLLGLVKILASIQRRFSTGSVPSLGAWLISILQPTFEKFHDRDLRIEVEKRMNRLSDKGRLGDILDLIESPQLKSDDARRFNAARHEYALLLAEQKAIAANLANKKFFGFGAGRQVAMIASAVISASVMAGLIVYYVLGV